MNLSDPMNASSFGRAALKKMAPVPDNFLIFEAGWLGDKPEDWKEMRVRGAEFTAPKRGKFVGRLVNKVPGSQRTVIITKAEMAAATVEIEAEGHAAKANT